MEGDNSALVWLCRPTGRAFFRPSKTLARHLGVPYSKLLAASSSRDDTGNLIWCSVLVLVTCAARFDDAQERWVGMANTTSAWLLDQKHYIENREALAESACRLLSVRGVDIAATLLSTVLPALPGENGENDHVMQDEAGAGVSTPDPELGDWKECYLDEPPYSVYYWNEQTNMSTWRHPRERAEQEQKRHELLERKHIRRERIAKFLPTRLKINRNRVAFTAVELCRLCEAQHIATVQCLACDGSPFLCNSCCDELHATLGAIGEKHLEVGTLRFVECYGRNGCIRPTPSINAGIDAES